MTPEQLALKNVGKQVYRGVSVCLALSVYNVHTPCTCTVLGRSSVAFLFCSLCKIMKGFYLAKRYKHIEYERVSYASVLGLCCMGICTNLVY